MNLVCKKLPGTDGTLEVIAPFWEMAHIRKAVDDRFLDAYGIYRIFAGVKNGAIRLYGVFDTDEPISLLGFELGALDESGEAFENHAFWSRKAPAAACVELCKQVMVEDYRQEGVIVKSAVGYIPDLNRAAQRMALKVQCEDKGIRMDKTWLKNGVYYPCREFRVYL